MGTPSSRIEQLWPAKSPEDGRRPAPAALSITRLRQMGRTSRPRIHDRTSSGGRVAWWTSRIRSDKSHDLFHGSVPWKNICGHQGGLVQKRFTEKEGPEVLGPTHPPAFSHFAPTQIDGGAGGRERRNGRHSGLEQPEN